jgi:hypothetical protein
MTLSTGERKKADFILRWIIKFSWPWWCLQHLKDLKSSHQRK